MKKALLYLIIAGFAVACSSNEGEKPKQTKTDFKQKIADKFGISLFELENGIGPVKEKLNLGAIDAAKVEAGEKTFAAK